MSGMAFRDRRDAGRQLGAALESYRERKPLIVGLPRGGVVVAAEVAAALDADLDILVVRKLGAPDQPELGLGAIAEGGVLLLNKPLMRQVRVTKEQLQSTIDAENEELKRRLDLYRGSREPIDVTGRLVIVVDDGLATGGTVRAAAGALQHLGAESLVLAVPVGSPRTVEELKPMFDDVVCLETPVTFWAIGQFYADFSQTTDEEVVELLAG
jgi:putative phosphoribosyl transferase